MPVHPDRNSSDFNLKSEALLVQTEMTLNHNTPSIEHKARIELRYHLNYCIPHLHSARERNSFLRDFF